ncbi:helix-turn-helix domain-containing protein [Nocardioides sp. NPDC057767]|uniref:helix-turn-helix domain-containing protein n=1 Tax=unclassified Nocardioides TaxID=2615069 RepID=UPI00331A822C
MGQTPKELNPFESARAFFGAELRHWRTQRGLSQAALGRVTHDSAALIGRFEKAERWPSRAAVLRLDEALETSGALVRIWDRADQEAQRPHDGGRTAQVDTGLGLEWHTDLSTTASTVAALWAGDAALESIPLQWLPSADDGALLRWHLEQARPAPTLRPSGGPARSDRPGGRRRLSLLDVEAVAAMGSAFSKADHQLGGGYARSTLGHYLRTTARPLLSAECDGKVHRQLLTTTARLCDLAGFMSFDSGHQGLAQRYFVQALRLARAVDDEALGAHILGDMTMQALHLDARAQAVALGEAAAEAGRRSGSHIVAARASAVASRAFARSSDPVAADRAMNDAERFLQAGASDRDPDWIGFFNTDQLSTEFLYSSSDLGRTARVEQYAATLLTTASSSAMQRRQVLVTATIAAAFLPSPQRDGHADPVRALEALRRVLPFIAGVSSARALAAVNAVRGQLAGHLDPDLLRGFESDLHDVML